MMPGMDGIEAVKEIRKMGAKYEKLPIIALTANAVTGVREMFMAEGFNGFLSKPIPAQDLDDIIREWLSPEKIARNGKPAAAKNHDSFLDDVGKISGINTALGLSQLSGDSNRYRSTITMFHKKIIPECDGMTAALTAHDINRFKISVHAMKTMLAIIGAQALSNEALELENIAKNHDVDLCRQMFPLFKESLLSLHSQLSAINPAEEEKPRQAEEKPRQAKVLVVDDMDMILFVMKDQLQRYGLLIDTASNGLEAVQKTRQNEYSLIFMDHLMPGMDGIEATVEIRKFRVELPIIALTSNIEPGAEKMFIDAGFNGFLSKPVAKPQLEEILKKWLPNAIRL